MLVNRCSGIKASFSTWHIQVQRAHICFHSQPFFSALVRKNWDAHTGQVTEGSVSRRETLSRPWVSTKFLVPGYLASFLGVPLGGGLVSGLGKIQSFLSLLFPSLPEITPELLPRRPRLLILVNPFGGRGLAWQRCMDHVVPMISEAGLSFNLIQTGRGCWGMVGRDIPGPSGGVRQDEAASWLTFLSA